MQNHIETLSKEDAIRLENLAASVSTLSPNELAELLALGKHAVARLDYIRPCSINKA